MALRNILIVVIAALFAVGAFADPLTSRKSHFVVQKERDRRERGKRNLAKSPEKKHGKFRTIMKGIFKGLFRRALGFVDPSLPNVVLPSKKQASARISIKKTPVKSKAAPLRTPTRNKTAVRSRT